MSTTQGHLSMIKLCHNQMYISKLFAHTGLIRRMTGDRKGESHNSPEIPDKRND